MGDSEILSMICRIGIFIVCARTVIHFRPKGTYEQYFKLLVSIMILAQIMQPLSEFFTWGGQTDLESRIRRIQGELELQMQITAKEAAQSEEILEKMTLEEVNAYLQEQNTQKSEEQSVSGIAVSSQASSESIMVQAIEKIEVDVGDKGEKQDG